MKVDLGQCAVCGAKNSKYVEKCYKCGAALPWAPDYVAPKNAPQKPVAAPDDAGAKTVVTPAVEGDLTSAPTLEPQATPDAPSVSERTSRKVAVPVWALVVGGVGLLVLGMGLWALPGKKLAPTTVTVAPKPIATASAPAPIAPAAVSPTLAPTADATTVPAVAPTIGATPPTEVALASGPTFDELYANLTNGTPQQQTLYWQSVKGQKISWRGEFVRLGNAASGPLVINCKSADGTLKVTVNLKATAPQTLPSFKANQSVPFEGTLESHSAGEVTVKDGRAG